VTKFLPMPYYSQRGLLWSMVDFTFTLTNQAVEIHDCKLCLRYSLCGDEVNVLCYVSMQMSEVKPVDDVTHLVRKKVHKTCDLWS